MIVPTTMAIMSFLVPPTGIGGAPGSLRCLSVIRSYTAQARTDPNNTMPPRSPLAHRWAKAQAFTLTSIGCLSVGLMLPGTQAAASMMLAGHISAQTMCRVQAGGYQTMIMPDAR